jgi:hypothetical protein
MIDGDGQFSEFFDTDPKFTQPYHGRPFFNRPGEGLGFPGRLATEADLRHARGGSGDASVWELAIPRSRVTTFRPHAGKRIALGLTVDGDRLFETDRDAVLRLVP